MKQPIDTIPPHLPSGCPCGNVSCSGKTPEERAQIQDARTRMLALSAMSKNPTGPTYTDLAREVEALKEDNAALRHAVGAYLEFHGGQHEEDDCPEDDTCTCPHLVALNASLAMPHPGSTLLDEMERLKKEVETLRAERGRIVDWKRAGLARQQAFLEMAHDLAEMEPAARDAAIRRIIDSAM